MMALSMKTYCKLNERHMLRTATVNSHSDCNLLRHTISYLKYIKKKREDVDRD
jgi:hypothetical protein